MAEYPTGDYVEVKHEANFVSFIKIDSIFIVLNTRLSLSLRVGMYDDGKLKKVWIYTVKPVYNGHPWDLKKVAV
jgi:hypothetical protein